MEFSTSFIIPTKNRLQDLKNCITSIMNQTILPQEIIVVDASDEEISKENQKNCRNIINNKLKLIYIKTSPGVNKQRNRGAEHASGDIIFFVDDDVVLNPHYHEKILEVYKLKKDQRIAGVQGTISNYYNLSWMHRIFRRLFFMTRASKNERSRFLPSLGYVYIPLPHDIIEVEAIAAGICSYYREIFNKFKFDESFHRCTDLEISYRIIKTRKYKFYQTPYALVYHNYSSETHLNIREQDKQYIIHGYKLVKKFTPGILNWLAFYWSMIGELILSIIKSIAYNKPDHFLGTIDGFKCILCHKY